MKSVASKSGTSAATRQRKAAESKRVTRTVPGRARRTPCHSPLAACPAPEPAAVIAPIPVMATRLLLSMSKYVRHGHYSW